jgi:hypothetical protein
MNQAWQRLLQAAQHQTWELLASAPLAESHQQWAWHHMASLALALRQTPQVLEQHLLWLQGRHMA